MTRRSGVRLVIRIMLVALFVAIAVLSLFAVGMPRPPLTWTGAIISCVVSLLIAAGIWFV